MLPIVTIGGFLGAGKTTLVNNLLQQACGQRLIVFVNDFGAINIDHTLIDTVDEDRISLKNGCVCCTLNNDLVEKIAEYANAELPPDGIVVEASGVADPGVLDTSFDSLEAAGRARLDARLYMVDADAFNALAFELKEEIIDHSASSDLILLNKADLVAAKEITALTTMFRKSSPYSSVITTEYGAIELDLIVNLSANGVRNLINPKKKKPGHSLERFAKWHCETRLLVDRKRFDEFVKTLPEQCLRAKGFLHFSNEPGQAYLFNLVGYRASLERCSMSDTDSTSRLVAIGQVARLQNDQVEARFRRTLV